MKRLLEANPLTGITSFHEYDHLTKKTTISYEYDQQKTMDVLEAAKETRSETNGWASKAHELQLVALIPPSVQMDWLTKDGINIWDKNHWPAVIRKLNDPDYAYLRTSKGRV